MDSVENKKEEKPVEEKQWFDCSVSGKKFQTPNGAKCSRCHNMYHTDYYVYVDMAPVCMKCRQVEINEIIEEIRSGLK